MSQGRVLARPADLPPWFEPLLTAAGDCRTEDFTTLRPPAGGGRPSAVLVLLGEGDDGPDLLILQRAATMRNHAGQPAFPGGATDPEDADVVATALREADEELDLKADRIEVIGALPYYHTVTRYEVTPVVALVHPPFVLTPHAGEVAEAFEVPLAFLLDPANHQKRSRPWNGRQRHFYAMPYDGHFIWGATAAMLRNLYHFLRV